MPTVTCKCKEVYHASDEHIGKLIQCRKCGRKVKIVAERRKKSRREPRARTPKVSAGSAPPSIRQEPARLDPKTRKRLMIAGAAFAAVSALLAAQIFRSLHSLPNQPVSAPAAEDNGMIAPPTPPLPTGVAVRGLPPRFTAT